MEILTLELLRHALLYLIVPIWLLAGLADYACHRVTHIEHNAGLHEALLHLAMLAELGVGVAVALLFDINAGALALMLLACMAHELTLMADLRWAEPERGIPWYEQWVHGVQQALPWLGLAGVMLLHPTQALAMVGLGDVVAQWPLRWKQPSLPPGYLAALVTAGLVMIVLPFLDETWRCWRVRREEVPRHRLRSIG